MIKLKVYGLIVLAVLMAMAGQYARGRSAGKRAVIIKNEQHQLKTIKKVKKVDEAINDNTADVNREQLRDKWTR